MKRYRIGLIGAGARGETFARTLHKGTERAELCGICDLDADRLKKFCDFCGIEGARTFTDPTKFFDQKEMDAVIITTPDFTHREVALQAIAAGKHFFLEKPIEVSIERARDILRAVRKSNVRSFIGFNMRLGARYIRMKEMLDAGILGQVIQIEGLEQLAFNHGASFMRRFHRHRAQSGGLINTKSSHDMDIMQWLIGHQHKLKRVSAFGGCSVFKPQKAPAKYCHECPQIDTCRYRDSAGFVFPVGGELPIHHQNQATYGGDLCVYNDDKDICDNMTVIFEWDSGIRGNFNLQLFQSQGNRFTKIWGENGLMETKDGKIIVIESPSGNLHEVTPKGYEVIHGKGDPQMIRKFIDTIEGHGDPTMRIEEGLAASIMALKAEEAMLTGKVVEVDPALYDV
jgi:predicted dehydrogenase